MGFNILGAIGGAVGGFFTGGPVGAIVGGIGGAEAGSGGSTAGDTSGLLTGNPLLPMIPPPQDTMTALLGQGPQPIEDLGSSLDSSTLGDLGAETPDAMASVADFS